LVLVNSDCYSFFELNGIPNPSGEDFTKINYYCIFTISPCSTHSNYFLVRYSDMSEKCFTLDSIAKYKQYLDSN